MRNKGKTWLTSVSSGTEAGIVVKAANKPATSAVEAWIHVARASLIFQLTHCPTEPCTNTAQYTAGTFYPRDAMLARVLFCSLAVLDPRVGHTMDVLSPFIPVSVILTDSSRESAVHVLMLSIQAVRGLPRLRAHGIVPCIISFSRQLPCFLIV